MSIFDKIGKAVASIDPTTTKNKAQIVNNMKAVPGRVIRMTTYGIPAYAARGAQTVVHEIPALKNGSIDQGLSVSNRLDDKITKALDTHPVESSEIIVGVALVGTGVGAKIGAPLAAKGVQGILADELSPKAPTAPGSKAATPVGPPPAPGPAPDAAALVDHGGPLGWFWELVEAVQDWIADPGVPGITSASSPAAVAGADTLRRK